MAFAVSKQISRMLQMLMLASLLGIQAKHAAPEDVSVGSPCPRVWRSSARALPHDLSSAHNLIARARAAHLLLLQRSNFMSKEANGAGRDNWDGAQAAVLELVCSALVSLPRHGRLSVLSEAFAREGFVERAAQLLKGANGTAPTYLAPEIRNTSTSDKHVNGVIVYLVSPREGDVQDICHSLALLV
jgi:hypothetical protein